MSPVPAEELAERQALGARCHAQQRINGGAMTTEKWQLYSQTGIDGTEYGIRIRPGYVVVGFQKEDAKEIIGLRDEVKRLRSQSVEQVFRRKNEEITGLRARIKELEALNELNHKNMRSWLDTTTDKEFLDKLSSEIGFKDAYIKRLEAEFLEATKEIVYAIHEGRDAPEGEDVYAEKVAREALEQLRAEDKIGGVKTEYGGQHHCGTQIIRKGSGEWHCPKCNPLLTAEQRKEEGKRDA